MKKSLILVGLALMTSLSGAAYDFAVLVGDSPMYFNKNADGKTATVTYAVENAGNYSGDVVIPSKVVTTKGEEYTVTAIGEKAFMYSYDMTSVSIPSTVSTIEALGFSDCKGLTAVTIPEGVTMLGNGAFTYCVNLQRVDIPSTISVIGGSCFEKCSNLRFVQIRSINPGNIVVDEDWLFFDCILDQLFVPGGCESKYENLSPWKYFKEIKEMPFAFSAENEQGINIFYKCIPSLHNTLVYVSRQWDTTWTWPSYSGDVTIPSTVTFDGQEYTVRGIFDEAFEMCDGLTSVTLPNTFLVVGDGAFWGCKNLTSVVLPEGVYYVGDGAFAYCTGLKKVDLPSTIKYLCSGAFEKCGALEEMVIRSTTPENLSIASGTSGEQTDIFFDSNVGDATLYVPKGCVAKYENRAPWNYFDEILELESEVRLGDVNGDGKINGGDITYIIYYMLSKTPADFIEEAADVNGDGKINGGDITFIIYYMLNKMTF